MSERITDKHLQSLCNRINTITCSPMEYMTTTDGNRIINVGHVPKRDLYNRMTAFIAGLEASK